MEAELREPLGIKYGVELIVPPSAVRFSIARRSGRSTLPQIGRCVVLQTVDHAWLSSRAKRQSGSDRGISPAKLRSHKFNSAIKLVSERSFTFIQDDMGSIASAVVT